jgi:hypothetical protein
VRKMTEGSKLIFERTGDYHQSLQFGCAYHAICEGEWSYGIKRYFKVFKDGIKRRCGMSLTMHS